MSNLAHGKLVHILFLIDRNGAQLSHLKNLFMEASKERT